MDAEDRSAHFLVAGLAFGEVDVGQDLGHERGPVPRISLRARAALVCWRTRA